MSWLAQWWRGRHDRREARRIERIREQHLEDHFVVAWWHEHHELYLRVLAIIPLLRDARDRDGQVATIWIKMVLFAHPCRTVPTPTGALIKQTLLALRADGLIQRTDPYGANSIASHYDLTIAGDRFLAEPWVQQTLATFPPLAVPWELRVD